MDHTQSFGAWLRERRKTLDFSKEALGQRVGCSAATIAKIETGVRRPSQQIAARLAEALEVAQSDHDAFVRWARGVPNQAPKPLSTPAPIVYRGLPVPLTPIIGRDHETQHIVAYLQRAHVRLLTLTGPPGVGKTRLSLEVAQRVAAAFENGVVFVSLAAVHDPAFVLDAIVRTIGAQEQLGASSLDQLVSALSERTMLLVLDNFEHVAAAAQMLVQFLHACPGVTVLATSRSRLWVRGEHHIRVAPLPLPDLRQRELAIAQSPAVQLFVQMAQAANTTFELTKENAPDVAAICTRLDGLPLAIELIAAHCDTLQPRVLLAQLDRHVLASQGPRDLPERQQTLRATLDWSYALLSQAEQRLFNRLGVFVGAWSAEEAAQLCSDETGDAVMEQIAALAQKSMIQHGPSNSQEPQFTLLETIRGYALAQLEQSGEAEAVRARHANVYSALAQQAAQKLIGNDQQQWANRLRHAHDNLQAAFDWLVEGNIEQAGTLCSALRRFWWMSGSFREGRDWVARVLAKSAHLSPLTHTYVFITDGMLAAAQGKVVEAIAAFETALQLAHAVEDEEAIGIAVHNLGNILISQGEYERGRTLLEAGLAIDRTTGDEWGLAVSLGSLGELCYNQADYAAASAYFHESLAVYRKYGDHNSIAITLNNLGEVARYQHDFPTAQTLLAEGLAVARTHQQQRILPFLLNNLSMVMLHQGDLEQAQHLLHEALQVLEVTGGTHVIATSLVVAALLKQNQGQAFRAATLLGAAHALRTAHGVNVSLGEQAEAEQIGEKLQIDLTSTAFHQAWTDGQQLEITAALQLAKAV